MNIAVIGSNEIGLATAILLAYMNHFVILVDDNQTKIDLLRQNSLHYYEPYLNESIQIVNSSIYYTTNLTHAIECSEVVYFTSNEGYNMQEVCKIFADSLREKFRIIVNKSVGPLGRTEEMAKIIRQYGDNFSYAYEAPHISTGTLVWDTFYPSKIVVGVQNMIGSSTMRDIYKEIMDESIILPSFIQKPHRSPPSLLVTDISTAELAFHSEKVFSGLKTSFINEINNLAAVRGANVEDIVKIMQVNTVNTLPVKYGLGWSKKECGENFSVLTKAAEKEKLDLTIIKSALTSNYAQRELLVQKVAKAVGNLQGKTIGILGVTYKPFTDDITDSPALDIINALLEQGAKLKVHDPVASFKLGIKFPNMDVQGYESVYDVFYESHILILCTEWPEYIDLDWFQMSNLMKSPVVFDARGALDAKEMQAAGYKLLNFSN